MKEEFDFRLNVLFLWQDPPGCRTRTCTTCSSLGSRKTRCTSICPEKENKFKLLVNAMIVAQVFVLKRKFKFKFIMFVMLWFPARKIKINIKIKINHILIDGWFWFPRSKHSPVHFRLSFCPWQGRSDICCCRSSSCCSCKRFLKILNSF